MKDNREAQKVMSMTGFAAVQGSFESWTWSADIRAVNGRSLDLRLRLPDVEGLEAELRKHLQSRLGRGNVTVQLKLTQDAAAAGITLNGAALDGAIEVLKSVDQAARAAGLELAALRASDIAAMRGVVEVSDGDEGDRAGLKKALLDSLGEALDAFVADRAREGAALAKIISGQIAQIESLIQSAVAAVGDREVAQKAAMERALAKLMDTSDLADPARLQQELALVAVKTDVMEELDRLAAHVEAAHELLGTDGPVGRKLDFLMQEFNREANTLCSKAQSSALTAIGLDLKTVIDQMREQVQNIE